MLSLDNLDKSYEKFVSVLFPIFKAATLLTVLGEDSVSNCRGCCNRVALVYRDRQGDHRICQWGVAPIRVKLTTVVGVYDGNVFLALISLIPLTAAVIRVVQNSSDSDKGGRGRQGL